VSCLTDARVSVTDARVSVTDARVVSDRAAVVAAMRVAGLTKTTLDDVVDVVTMRDGQVLAAWPVFVIARVRTGYVRRCAGRQVLRGARAQRRASP
jgi:hypothetical protein